jgi:chemotaxis signal transduction protein
MTARTGSSSSLAPVDAMPARAGWSSSRAAELRREFDQAFAEPPPLAKAPGVDLLAVQIAGHPYALRLTQILHLLADRRVVAVPSAVPELAGLLAFRGSILPVYSLRLLLGYGAGAAPRWVVLVGGGERVGLGLDALEGYLRAELSDAPPMEPSAAARRHVRELCRTPQGLRPLLEVASVLAEIRARAQPPQQASGSAEACLPPGGSLPSKER